MDWHSAKTDIRRLHKCNLSGVIKHLAVIALVSFMIGYNNIKYLAPGIPNMIHFLWVHMSVQGVTLEVCVFVCFQGTMR